MPCADTDMSGAYIVAEQLRKAVQEMGIAHEKSPMDRVITVSIGVKPLFLKMNHLMPTYFSGPMKPCIVLRRLAEIV